MFCHKKNHFSNKEDAKELQATYSTDEIQNDYSIDVMEAHINDLDNQDYFICSNSTCEWLEGISSQGTNIDVKIDTVSQVSIISYNDYQRLRKPKSTKINNQTNRI